MSNWEGGIRANAFASGGLLPTAVRGTKQEGLVAGWDWYATFAALAGVDPTDHKAAAAGLPPHDSHNLWPLLSGQSTTSPRSELAIGSEREVGGLIRDGYKIVVGKNSQAGWAGPAYPNSTSHWNPDLSIEECGVHPGDGCLYNIMEDPGEHVNLASEKPHIFKRMLNRIADINKGFFNPDRGTDDPAACRMATTRYGGFWGPFVGVESDSTAIEIV